MLTRIVTVGAMLAMLLPACSGEVTLSDAGAGAAVDGAIGDEIDAAPEDSVDAALAPDANRPDNRVIPIYIAASDESDQDIASHVATYDAIVDGIRSWYTDRLAGDGPLAFYHEPVRALRGHYTRAQWDDFGAHGFLYPDGTRTEDGGGCSMYYGTLHEMNEGGLLAEAGLPSPGSPGVLYYAIPGGGKNGSCGAGHYLGASELAILIDAQQNCPHGRLVDGASNCALVGAVAHEMGHGFGLPHGSDRPACTDGPTLMDVWWLYDDGANLCVEDRADLLGSGFFATP
jgi:hypothetical protein